MSLAITRLLARVREGDDAARTALYDAIYSQLERQAKAPRARGAAGRAARARQRLEQIRSIDFFEHPLRARAETLLRDVAAAGRSAAPAPAEPPLDRARYKNRRWVTRPRPGIDRVASAWLIRRFIDPRARFVFAEKASGAPRAIPYDMPRGLAAAYFPEANVLVPVGHVAEGSGTPASKSIEVSITAHEG